MIDYTLAKELKDAGFPQLEHGAYWIQHNGKMKLKDNGKEHYNPRVWTLAPHIRGAIKGLERTYDNAYAPTLSELIKACEGSFYILEKVDPFWSAGAWTNGDEDIFRVSDKTPEEAVAKLWLALHPNEGVSDVV